MKTTITTVRMTGTLGQAWERVTATAATHRTSDPEAALAARHALAAELSRRGWRTGQHQPERTRGGWTVDLPAPPTGQEVIP